MKKSILLIVFVILITGCGKHNPFEKNSVYYLGGDLYGATLRESESPYFVMSNIVVQDELNIEPGVQLKFLPGCYISIVSNGKLKAKGTKDKPIEFTTYYATAEGYWRGIVSEGGIDISFCKIYNSTYGVYLLESASGLIEENVISKCIVGIEDNAGIYIVNNIICSNETGVETRAASKVNYNCIDGNGVGIKIVSGECVVNRNNLLNNSGYNIALDMNYNYNQKATIDINAINNYWGTDQESIISNKIWDTEDDSGFSIKYCYGKIKYLPFEVCPIANAGLL